MEDFISTFSDQHNVFIWRALGIGLQDDLINSNDTEYVMRRIRELYLKGSTVTIVLIDRCTWARRYVDWEIQASLRCGQAVTPNGLLGIVLPSAGSNPKLPPRLGINLRRSNGELGYARCYWYPQSKYFLQNWIEEAFKARCARANLILNPRDRFRYNRVCP